MEHPIHVQYELNLRLPTNLNLLFASVVRYYCIPLADTSETFANVGLTGTEKVGGYQGEFELLGCDEKRKGKLEASRHFYDDTGAPRRDCILLSAAYPK